MNEIMNETEQQKSDSDRLARLLLLHVALVTILMSFWHWASWHQPMTWKAWWFPILLGLTYLFKHKLTMKKISYLVAATCLIYCLNTSHFELVLGIGFCIVIISLAFTANYLNGKHFILVLVAHLLTLFEMIREYWLFETDPFRSGYALKYDQLNLLDSVYLAFFLFYIPLIALVILSVGYTIYNFKKKK
jgi:hypothetical protein